MHELVIYGYTTSTYTWKQGVETPGTRCGIVQGHRIGIGIGRTIKSLGSMGWRTNLRNPGGTTGGTRQINGVTGGEQRHWQVDLIGNCVP